MFFRKDKQTSYHKFPSKAHINISDSDKKNLLQKYAPLVYLDKYETYFPASVEWSFKYFKRYKQKSGKYSLKTKDNISPCPDSVLDFFHGEFKNLKSVPAYAFWVDKKDKTGNFTDLIYFLWYPYNRGKKINRPPVADGTYGNHVGDWERVTVRLRSKKPTNVFFSQHGDDKNITWSKAEKSGDHPIAYSARGSHANYPTKGDHTYKSILFGVILELVDNTSAGPKWETWNALKMYDYNSKKGLNTDWPVWMWTCYDYTLPGKDPSNPNSGPIYRWGNDDKIDCIPIIGECPLTNAPTGPAAKEEPWEDAIGSKEYCKK